MKIYWSDREGKPAPHNATFGWRTFNALAYSVSQPTWVDLPLPASAQILKRTFLPTREKWIEGVEKALERIHRKELEKVVLARALHLEFATPPDPFAITAALKQKAEGAYLFCLQFEKSAFLGASPERLFARRGREIVSEAMAGTYPRGPRGKPAAEGLQQLLSNAKIAREFTPVQTHLQNTLTPLCRSPLTFSPLSIHRTQNVQHLYSRCAGELNDTVTDEEILTHLHPTPALCGMPKQKAYSTIQEIEPFERDLYGGAIGWSTPEASEWIVGIRSCLIEGNRATLFSGAGIVEGSIPEEEWEELNQKLRLYDGIFTD